MDYIQHSIKFHKRLISSFSVILLTDKQTDRQKLKHESRVTWATSAPILVFLGLSVLDLGRIYATDRRQTSDAYHRLMPPPYGVGA